MDFDDFDQQMLSLQGHRRRRFYDNYRPPAPKRDCLPAALLWVPVGFVLGCVFCYLLS